MTSARDLPSGPGMNQLQLGDVVVMPDNVAHTVRARVDLPTPVKMMDGFVILGELRYLLSTAGDSGGFVAVYTAIDYPPRRLESGRVVVEGATAYLAPHVAHLSGAAGELTYQVVEIPGSMDPVVVVNRGPEKVYFVRNAYTEESAFRVLLLPRTTANDVDVARSSATVGETVIPPREPAYLPGYAPAPPLHAPAAPRRWRDVVRPRG